MLETGRSHDLCREGRKEEGRGYVRPRIHEKGGKKKRKKKFSPIVFFAPPVRKEEKKKREGKGQTGAQRQSVQGEKKKKENPPVPQTKPLSIYLPSELPSCGKERIQQPCSPHYIGGGTLRGLIWNIAILRLQNKKREKGPSVPPVPRKEKRSSPSYFL